jgi:hypothetical protein
MQLPLASQRSGTNSIIITMLHTTTVVAPRQYLCTPYPNFPKVSTMVHDIRRDLDGAIPLVRVYSESPCCRVCSEREIAESTAASGSGMIVNVSCLKDEVHQSCAGCIEHPYRNPSVGKFASAPRILRSSINENPLDRRLPHLVCFQLCRSCCFCSIVAVLQFSTFVQTAHSLAFPPS